MKINQAGCEGGDRAEGVVQSYHEKVKEETVLNGLQQPTSTSIATKAAISSQRQGFREPMHSMGEDFSQRSNETPQASAANTNYVAPSG